MIQIHDMPRASGKTTAVIALMEYDKDLYCILPSKSHFNIYPKHLQKRLLSGSDDLYPQIAGRRIKKVILDEGLLYSKKQLAELYYTIGRYGLDVVVYGTSSDY